MEKESTHARPQKSTSVTGNPVATFPPKSESNSAKYERSRRGLLDALNKSIARFQPGKRPPAPSPSTRFEIVGISLNTNEDSAHDPLGHEFRPEGVRLDDEQRREAKIGRTQRVPPG